MTGELANTGPACYTKTVNIRVFIARLLSLLAIASFVAGPSMIPRAWAESIAPMAAPMAKMADASASMADMDCCPKQKQSLPDSSKKECPCAALCAAVCLAPVLPHADYTLIVPWDAVTVAFGDDQDRDRLADPPPSRPPRT